VWPERPVSHNCWDYKDTQTHTDLLGDRGSEKRPTGHAFCHSAKYICAIDIYDSHKHDELVVRSAFQNIMGSHEGVFLAEPAAGYYHGGGWGGQLAARAAPSSTTREATPKMPWSSSPRPIQQLCMTSPSSLWKEHLSVACRRHARSAAGCWIVAPRCRS
jgi:hypothetical protein